ncbi:hypothetical protein NC653_036387 [Populus alba x Populus x berolinensis]|uniref:Trichome birefringence-like C-terminal domain-containing protein n=1 Tax=Populus alba x Populus x berolinensis TaxID=444605 RepID=A0AAD6LK03_9ROSI|nr:hypothetical protein NC653_036387 [Populus alba x Populus x berolinensis]
MTIKVDQLHWFSRNWEGADVLMFNTGHWWNEDKTVKNTWKSWGENLSHEGTRVFSCRGLTPPEHYRGGPIVMLIYKPEANYKLLEPEPRLDYGDRKVWYSINVTHLSTVQVRRSQTVFFLVIEEPCTPVDAPQELQSLVPTWNTIYNGMKS